MRTSCDFARCKQAPTRGARPGNDEGGTGRKGTSPAEQPRRGEKREGRQLQGCKQPGQLAHSSQGRNSFRKKWLFQGWRRWDNSQAEDSLQVFWGQ